MINHHGASIHIQQEQLEKTKEEFVAEFGLEPRRDELTILAPKQDDPNNQVCQLVACWCVSVDTWWCCHHEYASMSRYTSTTPLQPHNVTTAIPPQPHMMPSIHTDFRVFP